MVMSCGKNSTRRAYAFEGLTSTKYAKKIFCLRSSYREATKRTCSQAGTMWMKSNKKVMRQREEEGQEEDEEKGEEAEREANDIFAVV